MKKGKKIVRVNYLARVEGEGGLTIRMDDDQVIDVKLSIFEPPRFFEAFLEGRHYTEAPDITARICGICPVAYQMGASHAMESACGVTVEGSLRALRRLLYCGEWIESHALHGFMLHAPDFLGYSDALAMAADHPDQVKAGLRIKKIGNDIMTLLGGREIHPINIRIGGFYKTPTKAELQTLVEPLEWALDATQEALDWISSLEIPSFERDYVFVGLRHPDEYPFNEGNIVSNRGLDVPVDEFERHMQEEHVKRSNALHAYLLESGSYHVGPLARYNLNYDLLSDVARDAATRIGLGSTIKNPFLSLPVRLIEIIYACDEALRIIREYCEPQEAYVKTVPREARGCGCTEAPRGICYHRYTINDEGLITSARIIPPTSQNLRTIEEDLREMVPGILDMPRDALTWRCEQAIRNYDPCISCATHFLRLNIENI